MWLRIVDCDGIEAAIAVERIHTKLYVFYHEISFFFVRRFWFSSFDRNHWNTVAGERARARASAHVFVSSRPDKMFYEVCEERWSVEKGNWKQAIQRFLIGPSHQRVYSNCGNLVKIDNAWRWRIIVAAAAVAASINK